MNENEVVTTPDGKRYLVFTTDASAEFMKVEVTECSDEILDLFYEEKYKYQND